VSFEGEAAMALEFAIKECQTEAVYPLELVAGTENSPISLNWEPMVRAILYDLEQKQPLNLIAAKFHNTLVASISAIAQQVNATTVVFTGGCFQNQYLLEKAIQVTRQEKRQPYWCQQIPSNDGGIALGQVVAALLRLSNNS
jgi:hydrogenase maturation protein HypF